MGQLAMKSSLTVESVADNGNCCMPMLISIIYVGFCCICLVLNLHFRVENLLDGKSRHWERDSDEQEWL